LVTARHDSSWCSLSRCGGHVSPQSTGGIGQCPCSE
jgi:hypothetical protein